MSSSSINKNGPVFEIDPEVQRRADELMKEKLKETKDVFYRNNRGEWQQISDETINWVQDQLEGVNAEVLQKQINFAQISQEVALQLEENCQNRLQTLSDPIITLEVAAEAINAVDGDLRKLKFYPEIKDAIFDRVRSFINENSQRFDQLLQSLKEGSEQNSSVDLLEQFDDAHEILKSWQLRSNTQS
ncbi:MAG: hypothetical protein K940chlam6_01110 [Chlamydiae bacterium]|nr:hypothetical protein [Chlamydiota bacterium]